MKALIAVFSIVLVAFFAMPAAAQENMPQHPMTGHQWAQSDSSAGWWGMRQGMQGRGMYGWGMQGWGMPGWGMMEGFGPARKIMMTIHFLPDMKTKLSLTDQQVDQLDKLQTDFMKQRVDWNASVEKQMIDLHNLIDKNAASSDVKKVLQSMASTRVEMMTAGYDTYQKMLGVLNAKQKEQLDSMNFWGTHSKGQWQHSMHGNGPGMGW